MFWEPTLALGVRRAVAGAKDAHNAPTTTYAPASEWLCWGIAPGASTEPGDPGRDLSLIAWTAYGVADDTAPTEGDLVVVNGVEYAVDGRPADWTHGPVGSDFAGVVVELKRAEG